MKKYILQTKEKGYSACYLIALLNALIYYNNPYLTTLDDPRWEEMIDEYGCRYGACIGRERASEDLFLGRRRIDRDEIPDNLPVQLTSFTDVGFHCSLVIDCDGDNWTIVNYNGSKGNLLTIVKKKDIEFV